MARYPCLWISVLLLAACSVNPPTPNIPASPSADSTYIIVPGWLADWNKESHGMMKEIAVDLTSRNLAYKYAPVKTKNNQSTNAEIVVRTIVETPGPIVIVSGSRGTSEVALAIAQLSNDDKARISLWVSISGAHRGSGIADYYASKLLYWPTAVWSWVVGWGPVENIDEMRFKPSRQRFSEVAPYLKGIRTVSVVTIARDCSHESGFLSIGCHIVASIGQQHDGLVLADDQILPGSKVIKFYGNRHMLNEGEQAAALRAAEAMS